MAGKNAIEQRVYQIHEKWEVAKRTPSVCVIRFKAATDDEPEMIEVFYDLMIGIDTPVDDIAFHFESVCYEPEEYSQLLLEELVGYIDTWNDAEKMDPEDENVPWKPDYKLADAKNPASLFVKNFNALADVFDLEKEMFTVSVLKGIPATKAFCDWLNHAIKAGISDKVKFVVNDSTEEPVFEKISLKHNSTIVTVPVELDMPNAMLQIAAMGDPGNPTVHYRISLMKLIDAMKKRQEKAAEKAGEECLKIATENIGTDPYWTVQIISVYLMLGNDKLGYKKYDEAL